MGTDIHAIFQRKEGDQWKMVESRYEEVRHYFLFAWLANVRNGSGFAGIKTHDPIEPLSDLRGLPEDFVIHFRNGMNKYKEVIDGKLEEVWMGDHSFSWLSADEILNAEIPSCKRCGIVDVEFFKGWDKGSQPKECYQWVKENIDTPENISATTTHVYVSWERSVEDIEKELKYFLDEIRRLKDEYGEVRMVFGFDS